MQAQFIPTEEVTDFVLTINENGEEKEVYVVASSAADAKTRYTGPGQVTGSRPYMTDAEVEALEREVYGHRITPRFEEVAQ